jgi:hypothetical protein
MASREVTSHVEREGCSMQEVSNTPSLFTLTCPTCGAKLQITSDIDRFVCTHCGNEHLVNRIGGTISAKPVLEALGGIRRGTDMTASELAIKRLNEEVSRLSLAKTKASVDLEACRAEYQVACERTVEQAQAKAANLLSIRYGVIATLGLGLLFIASKLLPGLDSYSSLILGVAALPAGITVFLLFVHLTRVPRGPTHALEATLSRRQRELEEVEAAYAKADQELQYHLSIVSPSR